MTRRLLTLREKIFLQATQERSVLHFVMFLLLILSLFTPLFIFDLLHPIQHSPEWLSSGHLMLSLIIHVKISLAFQNRVNLAHTHTHTRATPYHIYTQKKVGYWY